MYLYFYCQLLRAVGARAVTVFDSHVSFVQTALLAEAAVARLVFGGYMVRISPGTSDITSEVVCDFSQSV